MLIGKKVVLQIMMGLLLQALCRYGVMVRGFDSLAHTKLWVVGVFV